MRARLLCLFSICLLLCVGNTSLSYAQDCSVDPTLDIPDYIIRERGSFLVVVNHLLAPQVQDALDQYKCDLKAQGFQVVLQENWGDSSDEEFTCRSIGDFSKHCDNEAVLKQLLKDLHYKNETAKVSEVLRNNGIYDSADFPQLEGAIFVGQLPNATALGTGGRSWVSTSYFMNFNTWLDRDNDKEYETVWDDANGDGVFTENEEVLPAFDIYLGVVDFSQLTMMDINNDGVSDDEALLVNHYFEKVARFKRGEYKPDGAYPVANRALGVYYLGKNDISGGEEHSFIDQMYQGVEYLDMSGKTAEPTSENVIGSLQNDNGYEFMTIYAHGAVREIALKGETIDEYPFYARNPLTNTHFTENKNLKNLFADFCSCNVGDYKSPNYLAGMYLAHKDYGLFAPWLFTVSTHNQTSEYYARYLGSGKTFGEAVQLAENNVKKLNNSVIVGKTGALLGDPTLWIRDINPGLMTPKIVYKSYWIDDSSLGNGNGILEPGERAELIVEIENINGDAFDVTGILTDINVQIRVIDSDGAFGDIGRDETAGNKTDSFIIEADSDWNTNIDFTVSLTAQYFGGKTYTVSVPFVVEKQFSVNTVLTAEQGYSDPVLSGLNYSDIDGDGKEELLFLSKDADHFHREFVIYAYKYIDNQYKRIGSIRFSEGAGSLHYFTADLDDDGAAEIIINGASYQMSSIYKWDESTYQAMGNGFSHWADIQGDLYYAPLTSGKKLISYYNGSITLYTLTESGVREERNIVLDRQDYFSSLQAIVVSDIDKDTLNTKEIIVYRAHEDTNGQISEFAIDILNEDGTTIANYSTTTLPRTLWRGFLFVADFINDSKNELLVGSGTHWFLLTFDCIGQDCTVEEVFKFNEGSVVAGPVIGDFNNDAKADVLFRTIGGGLKIYSFEMTGPDCSSDVLVNKQVGFAGNPAVVLGDIVNDSSPEIIVASFDGGLQFYDSSGDILLNEKASFKLDRNALNDRLLIADTDHDGKAEVVVAFDKIYIFDFAKAYDPARMPWPMYGHDPQRSFTYTGVPTPPQWVQAPKQFYNFYHNEPDTITLISRSEQGNSGVRFDFEGLPAGVTIEDEITEKGKEVTLQWLSPPIGLFPVEVMVGDVAFGSSVHGAFNVSVRDIPFIRGDANMDGTVDVSDAIYILAYLFMDNSLEPPRMAALDANDDGAVDVSDGIGILSYLFVGGRPPSAPFPDPGYDTTPNSW